MPNLKQIMLPEQTNPQESEFERKMKIQSCLETGKLNEYPANEIVDWIFSEAKEYHKLGRNFPYSGDIKGGSAVGFSGTLWKWTQDYSSKNKEKITGIAKLVIDRINNNYDVLINEDYISEVTNAVRNIAESVTQVPIEKFFKRMIKLPKKDQIALIKNEGYIEKLGNQRSKMNQELKQSFETLYRRVSTLKDRDKTKVDIFNDTVIVLGSLDRKNRKKYYKEVIRDNGGID